MIKLNLTDNKITVIVNDKSALETFIKGYISSLVADDIFLPSDNTEMVIVVLKRLIVKQIDQDLRLEVNKGYLAEIRIDDDTMRFSVSKISNDKIGNGYTIALTLQG